MMAGPPFDPNMAAYLRLMTDHRRERIRHWPIVMVAFAVAVAVGVAASGPEPREKPATSVSISAR